MASLINDVEHPQLSKEMRGPNANVRPGVYSRTLVEEIKNQVYNVLLTKKRVKIDEKWSLAQKQRVFEQEVRPLLNSSGDYKTHEDLELLQIKNRQMNITNLRLMKNQAVTKAIQMFPPPFY